MVASFVGSTVDVPGVAGRATGDQVAPWSALRWRLVCLRAMPELVRAGRGLPFDEDLEPPVGIRPYAGYPGRRAGETIPAAPAARRGGILPVVPDGAANLVGEDLEPPVRVLGYHRRLQRDTRRC